MCGIIGIVGKEEVADRLYELLSGRSLLKGAA